MKKLKMHKYFIMSAAFLLCILILTGGEGATAEASSKATVRKVTCVDFYTGKKTIKLAKGKHTELETVVKVVPNKPENKKVTYKSSNRRVATVTKWGTITARKPGTAKITVTSVINKKRKATVKVIVLKGRVKSIKFDRNDYSLKKGETVKIKPTIKISAGGCKDVTWSTSNKKVATVDKKGRVKAVGKGEAYISAYAEDGTHVFDTARVTVKKFKPKYKYEVMFLNPPYTGLTNIMYVKTNNFSGKFRVCLYRKDGELIKSGAVHHSYNYADLKDLKGSGFTDGGCIGEIVYEDSGKFKVRVEELTLKNDYYSNWKVTGFADLGYVDVKNFAKEKKAWMQSVINEVTTNSMTKKEKMYAIQDYMYAHSVYSKTSPDIEGYLYLAADAGIPFWKFSKYEFNSYTSPALLKEFADMIGYPVENLYYKYPIGSDEWKTFHHNVRSLEDGTLFGFCHQEDNVFHLSEIKQIDLSKWNFYKCYK